MRKRQKMVISSLILGGLLFLRGYEYALGMFAVTGLLYVWALREGLAGWEWGLIPLPGMVMSLGFSLFGMLLPDHWLWSGGYAAVFVLCHYFLMLTQNIFSVAAIRTIGLYRAAMAVGFLMTVLTGFLLYNTILSFRQSFYINGLLTFGVSFVLLVPAMWAVKLEEKVSREIWKSAFNLSVFSAIYAMAVSFWPVPTTTASIFLTTVMYVYLGLSQHLLADRLSKRNTLEYLLIGVVVLVTMLATSW